MLRRRSLDSRLKGVVRGMKRGSSNVKSCMKDRRRGDIDESKVRKRKWIWTAEATEKGRKGEGIGGWGDVSTGLRL